MQNPRYALVAYIKNPVAEFVENLRRELHPDLPLLAAHLTFLPPRPLQGSESAALQMLEKLCGQAEPFEVTLGEVETFLPTTPTVYIGIANAASRMRELHDRLNTQGLAFREDWPYVPHLTIVMMASDPPAQNAYRIGCERWAHFTESRRILLERLTFVREEGPGHWVDVAPVMLGRTLVSR
jgi:2'-5' RNA ligase